MDDHEETATYNLAETCCASISIDDLLNFSADSSNGTNSMKLSVQDILSPTTKQTYGSIRGLPALRSNLASLYSAKSPAPFKQDGILITSGAIAANFLVFTALLEKGDGVVCMHPTYQQLYSVPRAMGCEVDLWTVKRADGGRKWVWDVEDLKIMVERKEKTGGNVKMVVLK